MEGAMKNTMGLSPLSLNIKVLEVFGAVICLITLCLKTAGRCFRLSLILAFFGSWLL
jgi:hypothetical protein